MPNLIVVTFLNQLGQLRRLDTNPFKFMPVFAVGNGVDFKLQFTANGQTFCYDLIKNHHETWRRDDQLLGKIFRSPFFDKTLLTENDKVAIKCDAKKTGYPMHF